MINDLPVGQNLMDHVLTGLDLIILNTSLGLNLSDISNPMSALNYFLFGRGKNMLIQIYQSCIHRCTQSCFFTNYGILFFFFLLSPLLDSQVIVIASDK